MLSKLKIQISCVLHYLTVAEKAQEEGGEQAVHRGSRTQSQRAEGKNCLLLHLVMSLSAYSEYKLKPPQKAAKLLQN